MATTPTWISDLFRSIDAKDTARFLQFLTDDGVFRYGSQPAVKGHDDVKRYVDGFFGSIESVSHDLQHVYETPDATIVEGNVSYVRKDGKLVTIPFANVFRMRGKRVYDYLVFADPTPLFA